MPLGSILESLFTSEWFKILWLWIGYIIVLFFGMRLGFILGARSIHCKKRCSKCGYRDEGR